MKFVNMKFTLILYSIIILFIVGCSKPAIKGNWKNDNLKIDGKSADWNDKINYFEDKNVGIGIANDQNNIYLCFISSNTVINRNITRRGFNLWFDTEKGTEKKLGIKFPKGISKNKLQQQQRLRSRDNNESSQPQSIDDNIQMDFVLLRKNQPKKVFPVYNNNKNINIELNKTTNGLVYELKIPFNVFDKGQLFDKKSEISEIGIGFELGEPVKENKNRITTNPAQQRGATTMRTQQTRSRSKRNPQPENFSMWISTTIEKNK